MVFFFRVENFPMTLKSWFLITLQRFSIFPTIHWIFPGTKWTTCKLHGDSLFDIHFLIKHSRFFSKISPWLKNQWWHIIGSHTWIRIIWTYGRMNHMNLWAPMQTISENNFFFISENKLNNFQVTLQSHLIVVYGSKLAVDFHLLALYNFLLFPIHRTTVTHLCILWNDRRWSTAS